MLFAYPGHPETNEELCHRRNTFHKQLESKLIMPLKSLSNQHKDTSDRGACTGLQTRRESYLELKFSQESVRNARGQ